MQALGENFLTSFSDVASVPTEKSNKIISFNAKDVLGWAEYPRIRQKDVTLN